MWSMLAPIREACFAGKGQSSGLKAGAASVSYCYRDNGITFNKDKFQFCQMEVKFAGFRVTKDGVKPSHQILDDITNFSEPMTLKEAKLWMGTLEQVA